jgi:hypothetical protein
MSKAKRKKKGGKKGKPAKPNPPLLPAVYERYYWALEEGEAIAWNNQAVYWDVGPGERPQVVLAHMRKVARERGIPVTLVVENQCLVLTYESEPEPQTVRIRANDGTLKAAVVIEPKKDA